MAARVEVSMSAIAGFSRDGRVYRAFGYLLGVGDPGLLLVPLGRSWGDLRQVTDLCPIPWEEVSGVLDTPACGTRELSEKALAERFPELVSIAPFGWSIDEFSFMDKGSKVIRLRHSSGITYARLP